MLRMFSGPEEAAQDTNPLEGGPVEDSEEFLISKAPGSLGSSSCLPCQEMVLLCSLRLQFNVSPSRSKLSPLKSQLMIAVFLETLWLISLETPGLIVLILKLLA